MTAHKKAVVLINPLASTMMLRDAARARGLAVITWVTIADELLQTPAWRNYMPYALRPQSESSFDWLLLETDRDRALETLANGPYEIVGVIPVSEPAVDFGDYGADKLKVPGNDLRLSLARRDKALMKEAAAAAGLRTAAFARCRSEEEILAFATECGFPLIVKTPAGMSTVHVYRVDDRESLIEKFHLILNSADAVGHVPNFVLAEEYIEGPEYIVNLFGDGKRVHVTDIWLYEKSDSAFANFLYRNTVLQPLNDPVLQELKDYAIALSYAVGVTRGPLHAEIKIDRKGLVMIEIAARYSGLGAPMMLRDFSNFDPFKANIEVFTQGSVKMPETIEWKRHVVIATPAVEKAGRIVSVRGVAEIEKLPTYHSHRLAIGEGDIAFPSKNLTDMIFYIWFAGDDAEAVSKDAEQAHRLFSLEVEGGTPPRQSGCAV